MTEEVRSPEMKEVASVASVAIKDNQVVLVREEEGSGHLTGIMGLPGGRPNEGETELDAAVREFEEETGLEVEKEDFSEFPGNVYHATIPRKDGREVAFSWHVYRVNDFSGQLAAIADNVTPIWVNISELEGLDVEGKLLPNVFNAVRASLSAEI